MADLKFEEALKKLEEIVAEMESGELSLDNSMKKYEEGIKLSRFCTKKLKEAQKKIEILIKDGDGGLAAEPFEESEAREPEEKPKRAAVDDLPF